MYILNALGFEIGQSWRNPSLNWVHITIDVVSWKLQALLKINRYGSNENKGEIANVVSNIATALFCTLTVPTLKTNYFCKHA